MEKTRPGSTTRSAGGTPAIATGAELLPDGSIIELVRSHDGNDLALLHWNGKTFSIAPTISYRGQSYRPLDLHPSIMRVVRLPHTAIDYVAAGTLFREVTCLYQEYGGIGADEAFLFAFWAFTTWISDLLPCSPDLAISGQDFSQAMHLFLLSCCVCRRGLLLAELTRAALGSLPMELRPTLLVPEPDIPRGIWNLCSAANHRGTVIPGRRGAVIDANCSKAFFLGESGPFLPWVESAISLTLLPARSNVPRLGERELKRIAGKFQPMFLRYRLDRLVSTRKPRFPGSKPKPSTTKLTGNVGLCFPDDAEVARGLLRLLDTRTEDRMQMRLYDPKLVIVELLWAELQDPPEQISVTQLAEATNALLASRGGTCRYSPEDIGWKLRDLRIHRDKGDGGCMEVRFSEETKQRVHYLRKSYELELPPHPDNCIYCRNARI